MPDDVVLGRYMRVCQELKEQFDRGQPDEVDCDLRIITALAKWFEHCKTHRPPSGDLLPDGSIAPRFELATFHSKPLAVLYGDIPVADFTAADLERLQAACIAGEWHPDPKKSKQWTARYTNAASATWLRMFCWLERSQQIPRGTVEHLKTVPRLRVENRRRPLVADETINATLPYTSPQIACLIGLQRITAARPSELLLARPCDIDRSGEIWLLKPPKHKGAHRGHSRNIPLGPACQELLQPFLEGRPAEEYLFKPGEAATWWADHMTFRKPRKTEVTASERRQRERAKAARRKSPKREYQPHYNHRSYRHAVRNALARARAAGIEVADWTPYDLRHARITEVQEQLGWDAAAAVAGHRYLNTTQRYSHHQEVRAQRVSEQVQLGVYRTDSDDVA